MSQGHPSSSSSSPSSSLTLLLDCPRGQKGCNDYECELRHLDPIEQQIRLLRQYEQQEEQQQEKKTTKRKKCIITASRDMGRTGSTWVFNAVRLLHRQAGVACDSYWIRQLTAPKIKERLLEASSSLSCVVLIKTHEYTDYMPRTKMQEDIITPFVTHVIVSTRKQTEAGIPPPDPAWMELATRITNYEDIVCENPTQDLTQGSLRVLRQIANHVGLSPQQITGNDFKQVDYQLMTLPIGNDDQSSKFWSFHSRRGGRKCPPKPADAVAVAVAVAATPIPAPPTTPTTTIFVTRHGARLDNGPDGDPYWFSKVKHHNRRGDTPLSPLGHVEANEMATEIQKRLAAKKHGTNNTTTDTDEIIIIISSPYIRCLETSYPLAKLLDAKIKVEPGISEVGSTATSMASQQELLDDYNFSSYIDPIYQEVMTREALSPREWGDGEAASRAKRVAQIIANEKYPTATAIVFIGHGASCLGLVNAFGVPQQYIGYCSLTQFDQQLQQHSRDNKVKKKSWKLVGTFGDVSHLSDPQVSIDSAW